MIIQKVRVLDIQDGNVSKIKEREIDDAKNVVRKNLGGVDVEMRISSTAEIADGIIEDIAQHEGRDTLDAERNTIRLHDTEPPHQNNASQSNTNETEDQDYIHSILVFLRPHVKQSALELNDPETYWRQLLAPEIPPTHTVTKIAYENLQCGTPTVLVCHRNLWGGPYRIIHRRRGMLWRYRWWIYAWLLIWVVFVWIGIGEYRESAEYSEIEGWELWVKLLLGIIFSAAGQSVAVLLGLAILAFLALLGGIIIDGLGRLFGFCKPE